MKNSIYVGELGVYPVATDAFFYDFAAAKEYLEKKGYSVHSHGFGFEKAEARIEAKSQKINELAMMVKLNGLTPELEKEIKALKKELVDKIRTLYRIGVNPILRVNPEIYNRLKIFFFESYPPEALNLLGENDVIVFAERFKDALGDYVPDMPRLFQLGD